VADKSHSKSKRVRHPHLVDGLESGHGSDTGTCKLILTTYDAEAIEEQEVADLSKLHSIVEADKKKVVWLHIMGVPDQKLLDEINSFFDMHNLAPLEVLKGHMRSKLELFGDKFMVVAWSIGIESALRTHQVIIVGSKRFVVSVQHDHQDLTTAVREKLQKSVTKIRNGGTDYLVYSILDTIVDSYFPCLERYGEKLEAVEDLIIDNPTKRSITQIHSIKRDLLAVRRHIWSLRETVNAILRDASENFTQDTTIHVRDLYDHAVQLIDVVETYRELAADLMDVYLSSISNRMNEVMKVLTIITTIFVPPSLVAGIYGMNFRADKSPFNMPELSWYLGYPFALALMFVLALTTLSFFWWKGWLGDPPKFMRAWQRKIDRDNHNHRK
jgi:magnesium transporter